MEEETIIWAGVLALGGLLAYEYFKTPSSVAAVNTTGIAPTGSTSNTLSVPATSTAPTPTSQTAQVILASNNVAYQGTVVAGTSQAELNALINTNTLTALTPAQQSAMTNAQISQFSANQQKLLVQQQANLSSGLPSVIPYSQASAILQIPQAVINNMKMGSAVGTVFGTFSLQPAGFVTADKVDFNMEQALAAKNQTWAQYNGLTGLGSFLRGR